jgi:hypothetical protein
LRSRFYAAQSVFFARAAKDQLTGMVFVLDLKLDVLAYSLNLAALPLSPANEIAKEKALEDWDKRHRQHE